jgi:hypothetical protein
MNQQVNSLVHQSAATSLAQTFLETHLEVQAWPGWAVSSPATIHPMVTPVKGALPHAYLAPCWGFAILSSSHLATPQEESQ